MKLSCYHDNYFMFAKHNGFVSKARVSAYIEGLPPSRNLSHDDDNLLLRMMTTSFQICNKAKQNKVEQNRTE
jgi:hypothetical protein